MSTPDNIYQTPLKKVQDFVFDERVATVFEDMINRSVPGYEDVVKMIGCLGEKYSQEESNLYDLGCSLGAVSLVLSQSVQKRGCRLIAVDNSEAMVSKFQQKLKTIETKLSFEVRCSDIQDIVIERASMVVLNYTLQFIPKEKRVGLLREIYKGILPGGILVLSEKVAFPKKEESDFQTDLHHTFKKGNGYSDLEISQKRTALENVLIPETLAEHRDRLLEAGFREVYVWFQCFNFISLVALK